MNPVAATLAKIIPIGTEREKEEVTRMEVMVMPDQGLTCPLVMPSPLDLSLR
jgi:hypothetical protein